MDCFMRATYFSPGKTPIIIHCSYLCPSKRIDFLRRLGIHVPTTQRCRLSSNVQMDRRYRLPLLDDVEEVEKYRRGGLHPVHLTDTFKKGRYRILHKLGYGGFSTVWLARDEHQQRLVSLKILTAEASQQSTELKILRHLDERGRGNPWRDNVVACLDYFTFRGPNGAHLCFVSQPGGPSISTLSESPGEVAGTRRLRANLARKLSRQLAKAVALLHDVGVVHGDITAKNVLLQLRDMDLWPIEVIYEQLGHPVTDEVFTPSGGKPDTSAPAYLVKPANYSHVDSKNILEQALLIDLGEAFLVPSPPSNGVGTPMWYCSPELTLEMKASKASDIWALACTMFEMRSGFPLFESFVGSRTEVLKEIVRILGIPPESFHAEWKQVGIAFADSERPSDCLDDRIREIGMYDQESSMYNGDNLSFNPQTSLLEPLGMSITGAEVDDLADLLRRTLSYSPEKRISARNIANHQWLLNT